MTLLEEIQTRHQNFHTIIERRARARAVPNRVVTKPLRMEAFYRSMWFWDLLDTKPRDVKPHIVKEIRRITAKYYGVTEIDIVCARRTKDIIIPRHVALYLCRVHTTHSLPAICKFFGDRDHTTALHAFRKIERLVKTDPKLASDIAEITAKLPENAAPSVRSPRQCGASL